MLRPFEIGVIGAGNAAEGIIHGLLSSNVLLFDRVIACDVNEARRRVFADRFDVAVTDDIRDVVSNSYIILIAVKPQDFAATAASFADLVHEDHIVISIMAGVSTAAIEGAFGGIKARVVRAMPNLASHVGAGMAAIVAGRHVRPQDIKHAQRIFSSGGQCIVLDDEALMDAVTAVSGTGPAYYYFFTEAICEAGKRAGLTAEQAMTLAKQTALGAARMMLESADPPNVLRDKVTSKGGTTAAALESMAGSRVFESIQSAVLAACARSRELGR